MWTLQEQNLSLPQPSSSPGLTGFKARYCGGSSHITSPWAKKPKVGLGPLAPQRESPWFWNPFLWVTAPREWVLTRLSLPLPLILIWLFLFLVAEKLFCSSSGHSQCTCSVCSCSFDVSVGGGELRIFLLHHLSNYLGFLSLLFKLLFQILKDISPGVNICSYKYFWQSLLVLNFFKWFRTVYFRLTLRGQLWVVKLFVPLSLCSGSIRSVQQFYGCIHSVLPLWEFQHKLSGLILEAQCPCARVVLWIKKI